MNKRLFLSGLLAFLTLPFLSAAQSPKGGDFSRIDEHARSVQLRQYDSLEVFTKQVLLTPCQTDLEKVRAIFVWLTEHIAYDCKKYWNRPVATYTYTTEEEYQQQYQAFIDKNLSQTLKRGRGVYEDYSRLFEKMCRYAGVQARHIAGFARFSAADMGRLPEGTNHTWNSFRIDDQWYLVDVTWAAGYVNDDVSQFTKAFTEYHFMMPPADFAADHYPEDPADQLLPVPISPEAFAAQPYYYPLYWQLGIEEVSYHPVPNDKKQVQVFVRTRYPVDPEDIAVIQGEDALLFGFEKTENGYAGIVTPKKGLNLLVMMRTQDNLYEPVMEGKW